jgi:hypothetical protein
LGLKLSIVRQKKLLGCSSAVELPLEEGLHQEDLVQGKGRRFESYHPSHLSEIQITTEQNAAPDKREAPFSDTSSC